MCVARPLIAVFPLALYLPMLSHTNPEKYHCGDRIKQVSDAGEMKLHTAGGIILGVTNIDSLTTYFW